ncbi:cobyrinate a,c-diamide synthase [sulfur-oxidizing endosymbiont of Gigantopelta aegis]|uniref:cobyrinate a,c-diamide synthase n=1 Tax=sulfur-oxidizing endosymbiont of Gigantopelta aegis TaxID=2794934 RepID=UPI0018DD1BE1|nr:cobyrinate a,c-diamide synthase [sulfur-oxidizing endosymbiont of Gigantopelta aegis]
MPISANPLFISAAHKSSGKTTITIGLLAALKNSGLRVQPFKKGPDYIDPLWHGSASGTPCYTLDFNTMTRDEILQLVSRKMTSCDMSLIEGNKGLYDGLDLDGSNSNAAIAKLVDAPVILVLDSRGMTRGVAPLILGYQSFDPGIEIAGVILNQLGGSRHESKLRAVIEHYTDVAVLGAVHKDKRLEIVERHLGLMPSNEDGEAQKKISAIGNIISAQVDLDKIVEISHLHSPKHLKSAIKTRPNTQAIKTQIRLAYINDSAFGFYYPGDLEALEEAGAELIEVDSLKDKLLPENIDGLFIGGGFPEERLKELHANQSFRQSVFDAIENGLPTYAECGGLMYLCRKILWQDQQVEMVGIVPADAKMEETPQGRGLIRFSETNAMPWPLHPSNNHHPSNNSDKDMTISAHEFHYSHLVNISEPLEYAYKIHRGSGIDGKHDGVVYKNLLACYAHLQDTKQNHWAQRFIQFIHNTQKNSH